MIDEQRLYRALGERLRRLRDSAPGVNGRLTQAQLASMIGLERTSITNIEKGNQKVPLHVLYRICEFLNVSVEEMLPSLQDVQIDTPTPPKYIEFYGREVQLPPKAAGVVSKLVSR